MRMWVIGTRRKLGIVGPVPEGGGDEVEIIPDNLRHACEKNDFPSVYGDFEVCPFTKQKPDEMQMVCVESAEHLISVKN